MKLSIVSIAVLVSGASATLERLTETCRTEQGDLGLCVQSPHCCEQVGGSVLPEQLLKGRASDFSGILARTITESKEGCAYGGVCCVLPELSDPDCGVCGVPGDGNVGKVSTPTPEVVPPTTTPAAAAVKKHIEPRIVGGTDAPDNRYCWQAAILNSTGLVGGGVIIARNWIVTTASNVAGQFSDSLVIVVGLNNFEHGGDTAFYTNPLGVALHPGFNPQTMDNDIAVLRTPPLPCDQDSVCTICLPPPAVTVTTTTEPSTTETTVVTTTTTEMPTTSTKLYADIDSFEATFDPKEVLNMLAAQANSQGPVAIDADGNVIVIPEDNPLEDLVCVITGFGSTGNAPVSSQLQESFQRIVTQEECTAAFINAGVDASKIRFPELNSFCTLGVDLTSSACIGDGGGPLACQDPNTHAWTLRGLIALGTNMCMEGMVNGPTVHVNIAEYVDFITESIHELNLPSPPSESGRNAYKVPLCGEDVMQEVDDGVTPACPQRAPHPEGRLLDMLGLSF